jgi:PmbA protein
MRIDESLASELLAMAAKGGAQSCEVYQGASRSLEVEVKQSNLDALESSSGYGIGVRVIKDGKLGFSYANSSDNARNVVTQALEASRFTEADTALELPEPSTPAKVDVYDPEVHNAPEAKVLELAKIVESTALEQDSRMRKVRKAQVYTSYSESLIMNSRGLSTGVKATSCGASVSAMAQDGDEKQIGWGYSSKRFLSDLNCSSVGVDAANRALMMFGARKTESFRGPVVLESSVAAQFLSVFASMLSGEQLTKGKSLLKGKIGENVMNMTASVIDDGLMHGVPGSAPIDGEGVAVRRKVMVDKGVLREFFHNTYTANRENTLSTGNATRAGASSIPSVGPISMYLEAENIMTLDSLMATATKGLYITEAMGVHTINPVSGEFSVGVSGIMIEQGTKAYPIKEAVISGNILSLLKNIEAVGDDLTFYGRTGAPSILISEADVSA